MKTTSFKKKNYTMEYKEFIIMLIDKCKKYKIFKIILKKH